MWILFEVVGIAALTLDFSSADKVLWEGMFKSEKKEVIT